jgi:hypothetical protein
VRPVYFKIEEEQRLREMSSLSEGEREAERTRKGKDRKDSSLHAFRCGLLTSPSLLPPAHCPVGMGVAEHRILVRG